MSKKDNYLKFISQLDLPFLETPQDHLEKMFEVLNSQFGLRKNSNQKFIDLGAGNGSVVIFCALNYVIKSVGIEIDPILVKEMKEKVHKFKTLKTISRKFLKKIKIRLGNLFLEDLKKYDFIYIYSLPTMQKYLKHLFMTTKTGATIISYKYPLSIEGLELKYNYVLTAKNKDYGVSTYFYHKL